MARERIVAGRSPSTQPASAPRPGPAQPPEDLVVPEDAGVPGVPEGARLVDTREQPDGEASFNWSLRPATLAEYIGQRTLVEKLAIAIEAARRRDEPLEHVLFHGPPGLGKTTLAHIVAAELAVKLVSTSGPALERPGDLLGILTNLDRGDVLFIDEVHRLGKAVEEYLYPAMEDFRVDFTVDRGSFAKTINVPLKPFTLIGATTRAGMLSAPLRDRFGMHFHLEFYPPEDLQAIVTRAAQLLGTETDTAGAREIARRSRGTPRVANRLLRRVRDYADVRADGRITQSIVTRALELHGIDPAGLDTLDRSYLAVLANAYGGGPAGIEALSATLNEEPDTLIDMVEPFLLKIGFVSRTKSGRKLSRDAITHLEAHGSEAEGTALKGRVSGGLF